VPEPFRLGAGVLERLNDLSEPDARAAFSRCCGALRWVEAMLASRPFASASELCAKADAVWSALCASDFLEAFMHHPDIGADMNELNALFVSTRDNQPLVFIYGINADPRRQSTIIGYEHSAVDGMRTVGYRYGTVELVDHARFTELMPTLTAAKR